MNALTICISVNFNNIGTRTAGKHVIHARSQDGAPREAQRAIN
jgi:hypothetical protein